MDDFKALLEKQVKKAAGVVTAPLPGVVVPAAKSVAAPAAKGREGAARVPAVLEAKAPPTIPVEAVPEVSAAGPSSETAAVEPVESFSATDEGVTTESAVAPEPEAGRTGPVSRLGGGNLNRVTVNLFDADRRALAVIKEKLGSQGHDFTNRSDSIKIGLRLAMKASREDLAAVYEQVKAEDRRFRPAT